MANFKVVISDPKSKKAYQKEVEQNASGLNGRKIGEEVDGGLLGLSGYKLEITGGTDNNGFPMRKDVDGSVRKKIILSHPPGFHPGKKGQRKRKTIRGNVVSTEISQVNVKITSYGKKSVEELLGGGKKKSKEEKKKEELEEAKKMLLSAEKSEGESEKKRKEEEMQEQKLKEKKDKLVEEKSKKNEKKEEPKKDDKPKEDKKEKPKEEKKPEPKKDEKK